MSCAAQRCHGPSSDGLGGSTPYIFTSPAGEFTEDDSDLLGGGDGDKPDYVFGIDA